jgi:alanine racemase
MLYGVSPFKDSFGFNFNLKPAMQLVAKVIAINLIKKGETIGYSSRFVCPEDMLVGVIAIGYADGYTSLIKDGTPVLVNQHRTKIIGRVSMDMVTIDLRNCEDAKIGDEVILWGEGLPVEEIARSIGIIPWELLTSVGARVTRVYSKEEIATEHFNSMYSV